MSRAVKSKSWFRNDIQNKMNETTGTKASEVRYICPKTGEYITKEESESAIPKDSTVEHYIRNFNGRVPFLVSIKMQYISKGWESITEKQRAAVYKWMSRSRRGKDYQITRTLKEYDRRMEYKNEKYKDDYGDRPTEGEGNGKANSKES